MLLDLRTRWTVFFFPVWMLLENKLKALIQRRHNVSLTSRFFHSSRTSFSVIQDVLLRLPHYIDQSFIHILIIMVTVQIDRDVLWWLCRKNKTVRLLRCVGFLRPKKTTQRQNFSSELWLDPNTTFSQLHFCCYAVKYSRIHLLFR